LIILARDFYAMYLPFPYALRSAALLGLRACLTETRIARVGRCASRCLVTRAGDCYALQAPRDPGVGVLREPGEPMLTRGQRVVLHAARAAHVAKRPAERTLVWFRSTNRSWIRSSPPQLKGSSVAHRVPLATRHPPGTVFHCGRAGPHRLSARLLLVRSGAGLRHGPHVA
jgi:hypothetical protein